MRRLLAAPALAGLAFPVNAVLAASTATLALAPASGAAGQPFSATYSYASGPCSGSAMFTWDTLTVAAVALAKTNGRCTAVANITPPASDSAPGDHTVSATSTAGGTASATYRVNGNLPSPTPPPPSPKASPKPSAAPAPKPAASPSARTGASPTPSASASPAGTACHPASAHQGVATLLDAGGGRQAPDVAVVGLRPAQMLPPELGHARLVEAQLLLPGNQHSFTAGEPVPCLLVGLGRSPAFLYALYAFHGALVVNLDSTAGYQLATLRYDNVEWSYLPAARDSAGPVGPVKSNGQFGTTPDSTSALRLGVLAGTALAAILVLGVTVAWVMMRRRVRR